MACDRFETAKSMPFCTEPWQGGTFQARMILFLAGMIPDTLPRNASLNFGTCFDASSLSPELCLAEAWEAVPAIAAIHLPMFTHICVRKHQAGFIQVHSELNEMHALTILVLLLFAHRQLNLCTAFDLYFPGMTYFVMHSQTLLPCSPACQLDLGTHIPLYIPIISWRDFLCGAQPNVAPQPANAAKRSSATPESKGKTSKGKGKTSEGLLKKKSKSNSGGRCYVAGIHQNALQLLSQRSVCQKRCLCYCSTLRDLFCYF